MSSITGASGGGSRRSDDGGGEGGVVGNLRTLRDQVLATPRALLYELPKQTLQSLAGFPRLATDVVQGDDFSDDYGTNLQEYFPVLEMFRQGFAETGRALRDPVGTYSDAWDEGQFFSQLVNDVGNVSLGGFAAGRGLQAAGATNAANRVLNVSRLGDQFGAAPATVWTRGVPALARPVSGSIQRLTGRTVADLARPAFERAIRPPVDPTTGRVNPVRSGIARLLDPDVRAEKRTMAEGGVRSVEAQAEWLALSREFRDVDPTVRDAALMVFQNADAATTAFRPDALATVARRLGDDAAQNFQAETFGLADAVNPEAARVAADYRAGRVDADTAATIDRIVNRYDEMSRRRDDATFRRDGETEEQFRARTGRSKSENPEQLGDQPMRGEMGLDTQLRNLRRMQRVGQRQLTRSQLTAERLRAEAGDRLATTPGSPASGQRLVGRAEQRAMSAEARVRRIERSLENTTKKIEQRITELSETGGGVPKAFRQVITENNRMVESLRRLADETGDPEIITLAMRAADELPQTLSAMREAGANPRYLIGGALPQRGAFVLRQPNDKVPRRARLTSERQAKEMVQDYSLDSQTVMQAIDARRAMNNVTANEFMRRNGKTPAQILGDIDGLTPARLAAEMRAAGYVAYDPGNLLNFLNDAEVKPDTLFIQRNLHSALAYTLNTGESSWATSLLLQGNQKWKNVLLPLSPTWYTGNTFGNALMAMIGAGIDPVTYTRLLVQSFGEISAAVKRGDTSWRDAVFEGDSMGMSSPRRIRNAGLTRAEREFLSPEMALRQPRTRVGRRWGKIRDGAFGANEFFDNVNKNAVYLHELAKAEGNPRLQSMLADLPEGVTPEEFATRQALTIMGDFTRMAPWERNMVAVMPFYRWARHITNLTLRMPVYHPARVAWVLKLNDLFSEDQTEWPEWLQGAMTFGDWVLPARYLNPFGDVAGSDGPLGVGGALMDPDAFVRSLSPFIKIPVAAGTGLDLSGGIGASVTMPTDSMRRDANTGRPTTTPLFDPAGAGINLRGLLNYSANQLPLARNIRDLVFGDVPRFDTGERIPSLQPREPFYRGPARLTQLVGLPEPIAMQDVEEMTARRLRNLAQNR